MATRPTRIIDDRTILKKSKKEVKLISVIKWDDYFKYPEKYQDPPSFFLSDEHSRRMWDI